MTTEYGLVDWGTSPWAVSIIPLEFSRVYATGSNTVRVILNREPLHSTTTVIGDALNPRTWTVSVPQTGEQLIPVLVTQIDPVTYDIHTWKSFPSYHIDVQLQTTTLLDLVGAAAGTLTALFAGSLDQSTDTTNNLLSTRGYNVVDLLNRQVPDSIMFGGTLTITSGGDYQASSGQEFVKKMIYRRLLATPARGNATGVPDYFHLPDYGAGLLELVKMPMTTPNMVTIKKAVERQVLLEPEVSSVQVSLSFDSSKGILTIALVAKLKLTGQAVNMALPVSVG